MARRISQSQIRAKLQQAQSKRRQDIQRFNQEVQRRNNAIRQQNAKTRAAINTYNRQVSAHNARVRANQARLRSALQRLSRQTVTVRYTTTHRSAKQLSIAYEQLNASNSDPVLSDLAERDTANSAHVLNSLLDDTSDTTHSPENLASTTITASLTSISPDLNNRWAGALFALSPNNPDAARHFCTSSREIIATILDTEAADSEVFRQFPNCKVTDRGTPTRLSKLQFLLHRRGTPDQALENFADANISDVIDLFPVLNAATHGPAGRYSINQLSAIKNRVEGAIEFVCVVAQH